MPTQKEGEFMTKEAKNKLKSLAISLLLGSSLGCVVGKSAVYAIQEIISLKEEEEGSKVINQLMQDTEVQVSDNANTVINRISSINVDNMYMDALGIDKDNIAMTYKEYIKERNNHKYQSLYDEQTDSIKWEEVSKKIYESSKDVEGSSNSSLGMTESFSEENVKIIVEMLETTYNQVKQDFPNYDTEELACKLEYYALLKSDYDRESVAASTYNDQIVFYPIYNLLPEKQKEDFIYHEGFHLFSNNCVDNRSKDYLAYFMPPFIEDYYASKYAQELTDYYQMSYMNYNDGVDLIQAALALNDNYQIDDLLTDSIYNDVESFFKEFPVYGNDKEKFFLDTITALRGLDLLLDSDSSTNYLSLKYTDSAQQSIIDSVYSQISKIFYNNLIVLNEQHPEMTLEENLAFLQAFTATKIRICIDQDMVIPSMQLFSVHNPFNFKEVDFESLATVPNETVTLLNIEKSTPCDYFIEYCATKYHMSVEDTEKRLLSVEAMNGKYQFPDFLEPEKKTFYQYLANQAHGMVSIKGRELVKQR